MKLQSTRKFALLAAILLLPTAIYLVLISGSHNFSQLPVALEVEQMFPTDLEEQLNHEKALALQFLESDSELNTTLLFHSYEKVYVPFKIYDDFGMLTVYTSGSREQVKNFKDKYKAYIDFEKWHFTEMAEEQFNALLQKTNKEKVGEELPYLFILDKERNIRGQQNDDGLLYAYDARSIAVLQKEFQDDLKVLLAEYRLELKKNAKNARK